MNSLFSQALVDHSECSTTFSIFGVGLGVGVGGVSGVGTMSEFWAGVGVAFVPEAPFPFRLVLTMTITARITATTSIRPKIICHLVLAKARSYEAVPLTVPGVAPGVRVLWLTLRVPQLGQRLRSEEKVSPQRRHFTSGIKLICVPPFYVE